MSVVIRLKVPIEMHYTVIPMGTSKVNSSRVSEVLSSPFHTPKTYLIVLQFRVMCVIIF